MQKSKILDQLANSYNSFLRKDLEKTLNIVLESIIEALSKNNNVEIRGFGTFKIKEQKFRIGRNPKDGTKVKIAAKKNIQWKMSKELFKFLNKEKNKNE